jgi:hypothetical protein
MSHEASARRFITISRMQAAPSAANCASAFKSIGKPLMILFDVVEQQYRKETIPDVGLLDKKRVIQRKLMMAFPQQQMRAYFQLKKTARDGEGIVALFAGLAPNLSVTQIMDAVLGSEVPLLGAGLLPVESASAGDEAESRRCTRNTRRRTPAAGASDDVSQDGRLAPDRCQGWRDGIDAPDAAGRQPGQCAALADEMQREFNATQTYLSRFGFLPSDGLDLIIVSSEAFVPENFRTRDVGDAPLRDDAGRGREAGRYRTGPHTWRSHKLMPISCMQHGREYSASR